MEIDMNLTRTARLGSTLLAGFAFLAAPTLACGGHYGEAPAPVEPTAQAPRDVDLVLALDTSGSMEGLLDACRRKLWDLCSQLAQARPEPRLRVALVTFGGSENADDGYVVVSSDLTEDLDVLYERLMAVRAAGGTELVGRAVHHALTRLSWSEQRGALKLLFVAGNESADQDQEFGFREQAQEALQRDVTVHGVFCGPGADGDAASWRELARFGGGEFAAIDHEGGTVSIATPHDEELTRLGIALNTTYLPFGAQGEVACQRQAAQDANTTSSGGASSGASRALWKSSGAYRNGGWDLVDACREEGFSWEGLKEEDLPEAMRGMTPAQRVAHVEALRQERTRIQARIQELNTQRQMFIEAEMAKVQDADRSLDVALLKAVRQQASQRGFSFE
jgi:hypothetical protein